MGFYSVGAVMTPARLLQCFQETPTKSPPRPAATKNTHIPVQNDEWQDAYNSQGRKRRARVCKDCLVLKRTGDARGGDPSIYCGSGKLKTSSKNPKSTRVFLCEKVHHAHNGVTRSCFVMRYKAWRNGTALSKTVSRRVSARTPAEVDDSGSEEEDKHVRNGKSMHRSGGSDSASSAGPRLRKHARQAATKRHFDE
ncbi:hypothetical protein PF005_g5105 [Phytophthora fragariae]|uniref:PiggyBac transposable element-derived protein 4 C-terminal zinc-ribbon domain-containing protein n=1 Tax=Phytophthora fragariae TaxID=53985 RepID=A0A6A3FEP8_9STRA|nr:hypothetical protein PF009_g5804 [Phytophthora fragariae]KAE9226461.1 hypothetical protein PF005_g5105 [Phytophthora fragariae]